MYSHKAAAELREATLEMGEKLRTAKESEEKALRTVEATESEMRTLLSEMDRLKRDHDEKIAQLSDVFRTIYKSPQKDR